MMASAMPTVAARAMAETWPSHSKPSRRRYTPASTNETGMRALMRSSNWAQR